MSGWQSFAAMMAAKKFHFACPETRGLNGQASASNLYYSKMLLILQQFFQLQIISSKEEMYI